VGRVFGMAIYHNELLDVHFTNSFYKHILGLKIELEDIQSIDPDYYRNLQFILQNDVEGTFPIFKKFLRTRFGFSVYKRLGCLWKN
jgi:hypothetical protein